ncbi:hypothetical protein BDE36_0983 [Arcticibacter tournemirensis]|uniref:hypothetical protein n=1 Tax=Arcticibacter tournemirensis TaxID=699437 RepID=UPI00117458F2|nr:hypothetical protein [Arcticibacter tournemirensis]TQM49283.1 hypothetical protein BDE36_0983 [Arcticibacter tournemirensis]
MKTLLRPYLLDFLKKQGYKYFLSKKAPDQVSHASGNIVLIPVAEKPAILKPCIGFDACFHINGKSEGLDFRWEGNNVCVLLDRDDILLLKKYLLKLFYPDSRIQH